MSVLVNPLYTETRYKIRGYNVLVLKILILGDISSVLRSEISFYGDVSAEYTVAKFWSYPIEVALHMRVH